MNPFVTWATHSGIVEIYFNSNITTQTIEYFLGNDLRRLEELINLNILNMTIQAAQLLGYKSVSFHGYTVSFQGQSVSRVFVKKLSRAFSLWAKNPNLRDIR